MESEKNKKPIETMPDRKEEFLGLIGEPLEVVEDLKIFSKNAKEYDPIPDVKLILPNQEIHL